MKPTEIEIDRQRRLRATEIRAYVDRGANIEQARRHFGLGRCAVVGALYSDRKLERAQLGALAACPMARALLQDLADGK